MRDYINYDNGWDDVYDMKYYIQSQFPDINDPD